MMIKEKDSSKLRVVKVAARKFRVVGVTDEGEELKEQIAPAEYAVLKGATKLASVVKTGDGWRVCEPTESSRFGAAVSPVGLDEFRRVKMWALERYA